MVCNSVEHEEFLCSTSRICMPFKSTFLHITIKPLVRNSAVCTRLCGLMQIVVNLNKSYIFGSEEEFLYLSVHDLKGFALKITLQTCQS